MKNRIIVVIAFVLIVASCSKKVMKDEVVIDDGRVAVDTLKKHVLDQPKKEVLPEMSIEEMIGQMIMVGFKGTSPSEKGVQKVAEYIAQGKVGGVLLLGFNITGKGQLEELNSFLQSHNRYDSIPLLISVDQEGGRVERLNSQKGFKGFPSAKEIASKNDFDYAKEAWRQMALELSSVGINLNLAPVADVDIFPNSPAIGRMGRSFSNDEFEVFQYCSLFVSVFRDAKILTSLKHFPGHGSAGEDSHKDFTDVTSTWQSQELYPYKKLNKLNMIDMVMTAHVFHSEFDSVYPSTLSQNIINGVLRDSIGFNSVVITDDLQMGAIEQHYSFEDALIKSVNAGCDILLSSGFFNANPEMPAIMHKIIMDAVNAGRISKERITESWQRIYLLKTSLK